MKELPLNSDIDRRETIATQTSNLQYVIAVVIMMALGVVGIVAITVVRPDKDNAGLITSIVGFLAPTTLSLLAFMKSQETHLSVNSRLDAFVSNAKLAARAQGRAEGRQAADDRTDALAADSSLRNPPKTVMTVEAPVLVVPPVKEKDK